MENICSAHLIKNFQTRKNQPSFRSYHFRNMKTKHENYTAWQFLACKKMHAVAYFTRTALLDLYKNLKKEIGCILFPKL